MLLVERPLRLGDIVEVGTVVGTVTNISIRSSTVRTSDGIEILVPNSTFVENNVTNWTYSNPRVRRSVTVGADYAAPPKKVEAVLLAVAARHPAVLPDPPPRVLLTDFGSDAMHFTLRYWIDYGGGADGSQIASDLRFMMAEALAEAGIAIPFPQRVVHIKTMDGTPAPAGQAEASLPSDPRPPS
jgi:small-conductance mechanosensitive channel